MTPQAIEQGNKQELQEELLKIKARQKRLQEDVKEKTARTVGTMATIGSAAAFSWFMGGKQKEVVSEVGGDAAFEALTDEQKEEKLAAKQGVAGIPFDLIFGGVAVIAGITDSVGEWSGPIAAIGTGALSSFAARRAYQVGAKADEPVATP
jgi:hypothetical protein